MKLHRISLLCISLILLAGCSKEDDDIDNEVDNTPDEPVVINNQINDFVWKGMNAVYLYKDEISNLSNDRFSSDDDYANYLNGFSTPESLFESLIFNRSSVDRFSAIIPDYIAFEQSQQGVTLNNGLEFNLYFEPNSNTEVFGVIRLVLNNSVADGLGLERGQIFDGVDGVQLTESNLNQLLGQDSYTLNFATYNDNGTESPNDDTIVSTSNEVNLTKAVYTENPVHIAEIIPFEGENVGYLVYNGFNSSFNVELNNVFADFAANNVQHLVLDLRYNPGGSVDTARLLGSMITGQFTGEVYSKLVYNSSLQDANTNFEFVSSFDGNTINSLNLNELYVLTTSRSASASELVINSLDEYIEVIQIGDNTTGKTQASITIYDSPNFSNNNRNPDHTYAMQPLVANSINVNDEAVPGTGLTPDIELFESARNFGTLGDLNEPLLAAALANIQGTNSRSSNIIKNNIREFNIDFNEMPLEGGLIIESRMLEQ